jgi:hypothetical protein
MKRFTVLAGFAITIVAALAMIFGCESNPNDPEMGNVNDPEFQLVQQFVGESSDDGIARTMEISFELFDSIPGVSSSPKSFNQRAATEEDVLVVDSFNYAYTNGWHIFQFWVWVADTSAGDTVDVAGIDSLQALDNGTPMQIPDSTMDALYIRCHWDVALRNSNIAGSADNSINIINLDWNGINPANINGSVTENLTGTVSDSDIVVDFDISNTLTADDIVFNVFTGECPSSGALYLTSAIDISAVRTIGTSVDSLSINGVWEITAAFTGDEIMVTYYDGTTYWQTTDSCSSSPAPSPIARWVPILD